jgi:hypothetical protein
MTTMEQNGHHNMTDCYIKLETDTAFFKITYDSNHPICGPDRI